MSHANRKIKFFALIALILVAGCGKKIIYQGQEMSEKSFRMAYAADSLKYTVQSLVSMQQETTSEGEVAAAFARVVVAQQIAPALRAMIDAAGASDARFWAVFGRDTLLGIAGLYYQYRAYERVSHAVSNRTQIGGGDNSTTSLVLSNSGSSDGVGLAPADAIPSIDAQGRVPGQMRAINIGTIGSSANALESPMSIWGHALNQRRSGTQSVGSEKIQPILDTDCVGGPCIDDADNVRNEVGLFE